MTSSPVQTSVKSAVAVTTGNGLTVTSMVAVFSQPVAASVLIQGTKKVLNVHH